MQGKIIKGIAGFYYVHVFDYGIYECKAKGIFRKERMKPLVGDNVLFDVINEDDKKGNINDILPRTNSLIRPAVANIDQALVIFSIVKPDPNFNLLDRFLIMMEQQGLYCIICFNKSDISSKEEKEEIRKIYDKTGYSLIFSSAMETGGSIELKKLLLGKTTAVAGPSGVGKSSIINKIQPKVHMETGSISEKIDRGKHTTRHSELIEIDHNSYIMDTPGFSSLQVFSMQKEELKNYYPEFTKYQEHCRFQECTHTHEPNCAVKEALEQGKISKVRYHNYILLYNEQKEKRRY